MVKVGHQRAIWGDKKKIKENDPGGGQGAQSVKNRQFLTLFEGPSGEQVAPIRKREGHQGANWDQNVTIYGSIPSGRADAENRKTFEREAFDESPKFR